MDEDRAWAAVDGEKGKKGSRLVRRERVDLKHGCGMRPNRLFPKPVDAQLWKFVSYSLVKFACIVQFVWNGCIIVD